MNTNVNTGFIFDFTFAKATCNEVYDKANHFDLSYLQGLTLETCMGVHWEKPQEEHGYNIDYAKYHHDSDFELNVTDNNNIANQRYEGPYLDTNTNDVVHENEEPTVIVSDAIIAKLLGNTADESNTDEYTITESEYINYVISGLMLNFDGDELKEKVKEVLHNRRCTETVINKWLDYIK